MSTWSRPAGRQPGWSRQRRRHQGVARAARYRATIQPLATTGGRRATKVQFVPIVQVNDIAVYYEIHGSGTPLVLIGGLGADTTLHKGIIEGLAARHQVIALDNRGAGRTDKPDSAYTIEMMADDTAGLMDALSIPHAHVLGISMGGRIALELALSYPDRLDKLILVSTSAAGRGTQRTTVPVRTRHRSPPDTADREALRPTSSRP